MKIQALSLLMLVPSLCFAASPETSPKAYGDCFQALVKPLEIILGNAKSHQRGTGLIVNGKRVLAFPLTRAARGRGEKRGVLVLNGNEATFGFYTGEPTGIYVEVFVGNDDAPKRQRMGDFLQFHSKLELDGHAFYFSQTVSPRVPLVAAETVFLGVSAAAGDKYSPVTLHKDGWDEASRQYLQSEFRRLIGMGIAESKQKLRPEAAPLVPNVQACATLGDLKLSALVKEFTGLYESEKQNSGKSAPPSKPSQSLHP